jgi:hypothetical protein
MESLDTNRIAMNGDTPSADCIVDSEGSCACVRALLVARYIQGLDSSKKYTSSTPFLPQLTGSPCKSLLAPRFTHQHDGTYILQAVTTAPHTYRRSHFNSDLVISSWCCSWQCHVVLCGWRRHNHQRSLRGPRYPHPGVALAPLDPLGVQ